MRTILVLDGQQRSALAAVRSLGRQGCRVIVGSDTDRSLAGASRYAAAREVLPDPTSRPEHYRQATTDAAQRHGADLVIACSEASILALGTRDGAGDLRLALPPPAALQNALDKAWVAERASELGIAVPKSTVCASGRELLETAGAPAFPCVIRPTRSWNRDESGRFLSGGAHILEDEAALARLCGDDEAIRRCPVICQEFFEGHGAGVFLCYDRGKAVATFAHRRIREKPPAGGVSVLSESVPVDPALADQARRLLDDLDWHGVAMVEFRVSRDGVPYIMEINPRLWGTTQLAVDAGVDFPWLMVAATLGLPYESEPTYRTGVRLRWLLGDLDHALIRARDAHDVRERLAAIGRFLRPVANARQEILRLDDPRPGLRELRSWLAALRVR